LEGRQHKPERDAHTGERKLFWKRQTSLVWYTDSKSLLDHLLREMVSGLTENRLMGVLECLREMFREAEITSAFHLDGTLNIVDCLTKEKDAAEFRAWCEHGYVWVQPGLHADKAAARRAAKAAKKKAAESRLAESEPKSTVLATLTFDDADLQELAQRDANTENGNLLAHVFRILEAGFEMP
jgi:hypothetical protein